MLSSLSCSSISSSDQRGRSFAPSRNDWGIGSFPSKSDSATYKQAHVPATRSIDAIPSTSSGVINHSDVQISATSTRSTLINNPTQVHSSTSVTNHSDVHSDTSDEENQKNTVEDDIELPEVSGIYDKLLGHNAPIYQNYILNAEIIIKDDYADDSDVCVTTFRPLNEKEKKCTKSQVKKSQRQKFERHEDYLQESTLDDTFDETDEFHCRDEI